MQLKKLLCTCATLLTLYNIVNAQDKIPKKDLWPYGVNYQIFVRSFCDSNKDSIGDINGITSKLDYLKDLGISGLWLTPFNTSPSYHKYDITNYMDVDPEYGTITDVKRLTSEAHKRGIHVFMDMVLNHTSKQHPWFIDATKNPLGPYRDFYSWKDPRQAENLTNWWPLKWKDSSNDTLRYFGHFGSNMPDLNYDNPKVREEIIKVGRFWLREVGIDAFRLDAAQHIYSETEHAKSQQWWLQFMSEMKKVKNDFFMVGEVWNNDTVAASYLKSMNSVFNFDLSWKIIPALQKETGEGLIEKYKEIQNLYSAANTNYVDATFLSNHDLNRISSEFAGDVEKTKLAAAILLTLPGSPFIYYGEELGMKGKKPDEKIREPFLWDVYSVDNNRTKWINSEYNTDSKTAPLSIQKSQSQSVFNYYKKLIKLRNGSDVLRLGDISKVDLGNDGLLAFNRTLKNKKIVIIHNLTNTPVKIKKNQLPPVKVSLLSAQIMDKGDTIDLAPYTTIILE